MPDDPHEGGPGGDVLYRGVALPHAVRLPILGIPVRFMSNSVAARDAVVEWFGMWEQLEAHPDLIAAGEVRVRIVLHEGADEAAGRVPMRYRMPDHDRVIVHTPGSVGIVDVSRRDAIAYVTAALLSDRGHFQFGILEMLTFVLVNVRDRLPLHAAMVAKAGVAVMLAGPTGLGKSTLAYQARQAGWTLLADDGVYVQTAPTLHLWGEPRRLYLPPDVRQWFPELADREPEVQANGKRKIAVPHTHDWLRDGPPVVDRATLCVLARSEGRAALERVGPDVLSAALLADLATVHDLFGDAPDQVVSRLCADGGWRLTLSPRPADGGALLEELVQRLANA